MAVIIETMPVLLGIQFYPMGVPLPADRVSVNGKTITQIFIDTADGDFGDDHPDIKILNDYTRYHLLAPCWDLGGLTEKDIMEADGDRLFEIAMEMGLDPI